MFFCFYVSYIGNYICHSLLYIWYLVSYEGSGTLMWWQICVGIIMIYFKRYNMSTAMSESNARVQWHIITLPMIKVTRQGNRGWILAYDESLIRSACLSPWWRRGGVAVWRGKGAGRQRGHSTWQRLHTVSSQRTQVSSLTSSLVPGASSWSACRSSYNKYGDEARYGVMRSAKRTQTYWRAGCWIAGGAACGGAPLARRGTPPTTTVLRRRWCRRYPSASQRNTYIS